MRSLLLGALALNCYITGEYPGVEIEHVRVPLKSNAILACEAGCKQRGEVHTDSVDCYKLCVLVDRDAGR